MRLSARFLVVALLLLAGCGGEPPGDGDAPAATATASPAGDARFPDVVSAVLRPASGGTYALEVTVSSPYDSPDRYADGWRVLEAGTTRVLGTHMLAHDHANEQPFTRTQSGLRIPDDVTRITVEGRDQANGYGGETVDVPVPSR